MHFLEDEADEVLIPQFSRDTKILSGTELFVLTYKNLYVRLDLTKDVIKNLLRTSISGYVRGFFGHFFVNSGAKKTQKISLKLSTLEAR